MSDTVLGKLGLLEVAGERPVPERKKSVSNWCAAAEEATSETQ